MTRPTMNEAEKTDPFRGLAHPTRRRVLKLLTQGERSVNELLTAMESQPGLSQHLAILRETNLVTHRQQGRRRYYKLNRPTLAPLRKWLTTLDQP